MLHPRPLLPRQPGKWRCGLRGRRWQILDNYDSCCHRSSGFRTTTPGPLVALHAVNWSSPGYALRLSSSCPQRCARAVLATWAMQRVAHRAQPTPTPTNPGRAMPMDLSVLSDVFVGPKVSHTTMLSGFLSFRCAAEEMNSPQCSSCPPNSKSSKASESWQACECSFGAISAADSALRCQCPASQALVAQHSSEHCVPCAKLHLQCPEPGSNATTADVIKGYARLRRKSSKVFKCLDSERCVPSGCGAGLASRVTTPHLPENH